MTTIDSVSSVYICADGVAFASILPEYVRLVCAGVGP